MPDAETVYQKVRQLDAFQLREVTDFMDFLLRKRVRAEPLKTSPHPYKLRSCRRLGAKLANLDKIGEVLAYAEGEDYR